MIELYQESELSDLKRKLIIQIAAAAAVTLLTLCVCVLICTRVTVYNANRLLVPCVTISVLGSWIVLTIRIFGIDATRCAVRHTEAMLKGERETVSGTFVLTDERIRIKNGVSMLRVLYEGPERTGTLQLFDRKRDRFDAAHACAVSVVHGFVVAYREGMPDD